MFYKGDYYLAKEHGAVSIFNILNEIQQDPLDGDDNYVGVHTCGALEELLREKCPVLLRAVSDEFSFMVKLITGERILFEKAEYAGGDWVHLCNARFSYDDDNNTVIGVFPRGIDVRISNIVWAKDAPFGS